MPFSNRTVSCVLVVLSLAFLAACGSSSNKPIPPPTGGFSNTNLNGTYVFSTEGVDANGAPITIAGAFTACGCTGGTISGGNVTFVDPGIPVSVSGQPINASSYAVGVDGRGTATLSTSAASPFNVIKLDFALNSTSGGVVSEFDATGSGSGTIAQATSVAQTDIENSSGYAYLVTGTVANGNAFSSAGAFVVSSTDNLSGGEYDLDEMNGTGVVSNNAGFTFTTASTITVGSGTAPGTATLTDGSNTYTFDVYAVNANDLKFIETDTNFFSTGDAFTQAASLPSSSATLAFTMSGLDGTSGAATFPFSMGGLLPFSSGTITGGTQDYNDDGATNTQTSVGGSFNTALTNGRATLLLTGFYIGGALVPPNTTYAAYPTTNGTLLIEIDGAGILAGSALVQTNTSLAASQGYAMDISAANISGGFEEDDISELSTTSSGFSGLVDVNDEGTFSSAQTFDGTYSSLSAGRYSFTANPSGNFGGVSGAVYTVDGQTLLFLEGDTTQIGTGILQVQNASGASKAAARVPVKTFHQLAAHAAKWHKK